MTKSKERVTLAVHLGWIIGLMFMTFMACQAFKSKVPEMQYCTLIDSTKSKMFKAQWPGRYKVCLYGEDAESNFDRVLKDQYEGL